MTGEPRLFNPYEPGTLAQSFGGASPAKRAAIQSSVGPALSAAVVAWLPPASGTHRTGARLRHSARVKVRVTSDATTGSSPLCAISTGPRRGAGPYAVFVLPEGGWAAPIEIGAVLEGARIFSPHIVLLDAAGGETRSFRPEHYNFRSHGYEQMYSVQFLPQAGERYVLVTSNPLRVGSVYDAIRTSTQTTTIWTGFGAANWTTGVEASVARGFSYSGLVRANVFRPEKDDD